MTLEDYLGDLKWLTQVYYAYYRFVKKRDPVELEKYFKRAYKKTLKYIHESIDIGRLRRDFPIFSLDENYIKNIEEYYTSLWRTLDYKTKSFLLTPARKRLKAC